MSASEASTNILAGLGELLPEIESVYTDLHAHPELSMQETRAAGIAADRLRAVGYEVATAIGNTGVVGLLRNGEGPAVMLRADMDALPVLEATGLPYCQQGDRHRQHRKDGVCDARLRSRYACSLAHRRCDVICEGA